MKIFKTKYKTKKVIMALGGESAGNFSCYNNGKIYYSANFGDLQNENNFTKYSDSISSFLKKNKLKPDCFITDLHPLFRTTEMGELASLKKKSKLFKVQHHLAHIFSALGEAEMQSGIKTSSQITGIACDGTGLGIDDRVWGGEIFDIDLKNKTTKRIAHLENQILLGSQMAILEPARMLISILNNFLSKDEIYGYTKKYYSKNEFELLYNQLSERFNCLETSSTARVMDAVSILLGFAGNKISYKHEPVDLLEQNSTIPYDIFPEIKLSKDKNIKIIKTTPVFKYLIKEIKKDASSKISLDQRKQLAGSAQLYLARGFYEIIKNKKNKIFFAGGMANNKIISTFLENRGVITNKNFDRGDNALSFGQLIYYLKMN